jgi:acyl-CoA reductase-like NAD-dependent aldehyde dehydrogenase
LYDNLKMWIDGQWVDAESGGTFATFNVTTGEALGYVPLAGQADVDKAVAAARKAFPIWSEKTPAERSAVLMKIAAAIRESLDDMAKLDALEHGLPYHIAKGRLWEPPAILKWRHTTVDPLSER